MRVLDVFDPPADPLAMGYPVAAIGREGRLKGGCHGGEGMEAQRSDVAWAYDAGAGGGALEMPREAGRLCCLAGGQLAVLAMALEDVVHTGEGRRKGRLCKCRHLLMLYWAGCGMLQLACFRRPLLYCVAGSS